MSEPAPDLDVAVEWLRNLEPDGPWLLVAINPDRQPNQPAAELSAFGPTTEAACRTWLARLSAARWNLYYTSNLPRSDPFTTAKKEAVQRLRVLHVDADLPGSADDPAAAATLLGRLRSFDPPPTAIVFTGGGYQAIWRLAAKLAAPEWLTRVEAVNTALWRSLGADHCHDASRLLRLPGTVNVPSATKRQRGRVPVLSYLVEADWNRVWSFDDPVPRLPDEAPELPAAAPSAPRASRAQAVAGVFDDLPAVLRRRIRSGDASDFPDHAGRPDRSRLLWYVVSSLIRRGWSDDDVRTLILNRNYGVSAHVYDQTTDATAYANRQIANAHTAIVTDWNRTTSGEIIKTDQANVDRALAALGVVPSYNALSDQVWLNGAGPMRPLTDSEIDATWLNVQRDCGFLPDKQFFHTVLVNRARERSYHPVRDYLAGVEPTWDGRPRIGAASPSDRPAPSWLTTYGGAEDTPYTRAVGRLTLVAAVRRIRSPGCKFDEMLMLISEVQGNNKSTAVRTLSVRDEEWFNDYLPIGEAGREVIEHIRGFWIIEAQEMAGLTTRDLERIKGFCSRQTDRGRMAYDRLMSDVPRSCVFIGTTNETALFTDLANRRFWPVLVAGFDIAALRRDLNQLWAEAARAETAGESIRLDESLWPAAAEVQSRFRVDDAWADLIEREIGLLTGRITTVDLYKLINKATGTIVHTDGRRLAKAMRELGFERYQVRDGRSWNNNPRWYYGRGTPVERARDIYVFRDPVTGLVTVTNEPQPIETRRGVADNELPM